MASITITIPTPVLTAGQSFKVRYRVHPAGSWTTVTPNKTNAPFTITGLTPDDYDFEFTLVKTSGSPAVEEFCPAVIRTFTVIDDLPCIEAEAEIIEIEPGVFQIKITYTGTPSACFYEVRYNVAGSAPMIALYYTLPASPFYLPATNAPYNVEIRAYTCDGLYTVCFDEEIDPPITGCEHSILVNAELIFYNGGIYIHLEITQSTPMSPLFLLSYHQSNVVNTGIPDPGGTFPFTGIPTTTHIYKQVTPNFDVQLTNGDQVLKYSGSFTDLCNYTNKFDVELIVT